MNERLRSTGRRLLFGRPRPDTHRGWLARHRRHPAPSRAAGESVELAAAPSFPYALVADDDVPEQVPARVSAVLARASRFSARPILYARVTVRTDRDPAVRRSAFAAATLDVSGRTIVVHAAADTALDAIDLLERRLRRRLDRLDARRRALRRKRAAGEEPHQTGLGARGRRADATDGGMS
jgi:ribosome-associated translation inhibitor RaiA